MTELNIEQEIQDKKNLVSFRTKEKINSSFLLIAENKNGKLMALSANIDSDGDIELYGIKKGEYKAIRTIKKEALINNSKIKAIYGNSDAADKMRDYISNDITQEQQIEIAKQVKNGSTQDVEKDIDNFVLNKMEQQIERKKQAVSQENMEKLNNKASLLFKSENGYKFVAIKKEGDKYFLEKTKEYLSEKEILENKNIKGVYGGSELATELKNLFKDQKIKVGLSNKEETENTIDEIKGFLKEKDGKKKRSTLKR